MLDVFVEVLFLFIQIIIVILLQILIVVSSDFLIVFYLNQL